MGNIEKRAARSGFVQKGGRAGGGKFLSLVLLKFAVSFIYTTLASLKEPLVRFSTAYADVSVINIIKAIGVLPCSILFVLAYAKLSNKFSSQKIFYAICLFFFSFLVLYSFVLYPYGDAVTPRLLADKMITRFPNHKSYIAALCQWPHTLFFIIAELWSQVGISILYWGTVNELSSLSEAKRQYPIFIAAGCMGGILALLFTMYETGRYTEPAQYVHVVQHTTLAAAAMVLAMVVIRSLMQRCITAEGAEGALRGGVKDKLSLAKSIRWIMHDPALLAIAVMVIGSGVAISLTELTWKAHVSQRYFTRASYQLFMSKIQIMLLLSSASISFFFSGKLMRRFSWGAVASVMPLVVLVTGGIFLSFSYYSGALEEVASRFGMPALTLVIAMGALHVLASKLAKYAFFDSCKEMAYIPLSETSRVKGKAAVDMLGSRVGKSGSYFLYEISYLLIGNRDVMGVGLVLLPFLFCIVLAWLQGVRYLDGRMKKDR